MRSCRCARGYRSPVPAFAPHSVPPTGRSPTRRRSQRRSIRRGEPWFAGSRRRIVAASASASSGFATRRRDRRRAATIAFSGSKRDGGRPQPRQPVRPRLPPPLERLRALRVHVRRLVVGLHRVRARRPHRLPVPAADLPPLLRPARPARVRLRRGRLLLAAEPGAAALLRRADGGRLRALLPPRAAAAAQLARPPDPPDQRVLGDGPRRRHLHDGVVRRPGHRHRRQPPPLLAAALRPRGARRDPPRTRAARTPRHRSPPFRPRSCTTRRCAARAWCRGRRGRSTA